MKALTCHLPASLHRELTRRMSADHVSSDHIIAEALSRYLGKPLHTLFQVSTSAALVEGLYQGAVKVSRLLMHGDFGVGTFVDLEGEMIVLDGVCYQASADGSVRTVEGETLIPYAVVTRFTPETAVERHDLASLEELIAACDDLRPSSNVFYAFCIEGSYAAVKTRVMKTVQEGVGLKAASGAQQEFDSTETEGTLVGLWSPVYASSFSVPGYHFHFLSKDRRHGGHVLSCRIRSIRIESCQMSELHVSLPETEEFLRADLSKDPNADLASAEKDHS